MLRPEESIVATVATFDADHVTMTIPAVTGKRVFLKLLCVHGTATNNLSIYSGTTSGTKLVNMELTVTNTGTFLHTNGEVKSKVGEAMTIHMTTADADATISATYQYQ